MAGPNLNSNRFGLHLPDGWSEREREFRYCLIKGRFAETLIEELFLSLKYKVFRYGMENTIPGIVDLLTGVRSDVADELRRMPDFVIQDPRTKEVHYVEVKFRADGCFSFKGLKGEYPYMNAFIIVVSKKHIKCLTAEELKAGKSISAECRNYLGNRKEFETDRQVIVDFCNFAVRFFENA
jgi:hypothetical protein